MPGFRVGGQAPLSPWWGLAPQTLRGLRCERSLQLAASGGKLHLRKNWKWRRRYSSIPATQPGMAYFSDDLKTKRL